MDGGTAGSLVGRDEALDQFLRLLANPFTVQLQGQSISAALGTSIGFTLLLAIAFSFLRPYNNVVYAPRLKHADDRHAPPPMGRGIFAWVKPILKTNEQDLVSQVGLDATIFIRFLRMCRNIFITTAILGITIIIPVNYVVSNSRSFPDQVSWILQLTPLNINENGCWGLVFVAWLFNFVIMGFLFWNYRKVLALRRQYFDSPEYQKSLHSKTLMINDLPKEYRSDEGIGRVIDEVALTSSFSRCAIGRNVKELPVLLEQHNKTVRQLEKYLVKYLKDPDNLPRARPLCKPSKEDPSRASYAKGQKVDAVEYLTGRITELETEIKEVRLAIDKRNAMPYGFASYEEISEAHGIAFAARNKHPQGTTIVLAPQPNDVLWKNMPLSRSARRWRRIINNVWVTLFTIVYVAPNTMMSIFLPNLANLGLVWPAFQDSLSAHTTWWAVVQGVASPAITSLIFLLLPMIFRYFAIRAGDQTKTGRERHVVAKLYSFFIFNNLICFNLFSACWAFGASVIHSTQEGASAWDAIKKADIIHLLFSGLCNNSAFWVTYLLQRNLGAAIDLAQLWTLFWSFCVRKLSSPTPREMIELTAPPAFDYASYYNYFLFYATVTLCYATIQPLVLPAAALYFALDMYMKKYLLLYIFVTKTESGGMFWRVTFNRLVFATIFSNLIVFFVVWVRGNASHTMAFATIPLPLLMVAFKVYCRRVFDHKIHYYTTHTVVKDSERVLNTKIGSKGDRLASRYGHPALYKPLITPMVHAKAQGILASIYRGRLSDGKAVDSSDLVSVSGYSDSFALNLMHAGQPGRTASKNQPVPGFELVPESKLDFGYYKNRPEFGEEHGGGQMYSHPGDHIDRPGTASTFYGGYSSPGSSRAGSPAPNSVGNRRAVSGLAEEGRGDVGTSRIYSHPSDSEVQVPLVADAADMPITAPRPQRSGDGGGARAPGILGGGPRGYGGLPQQDDEPLPEESTSYEGYRTATRQNAGWQGWTG